MNILMNLFDNSNIKCNKTNKNKIYDLYNNIVLNKFVHSNKYKSSTIFTIYNKAILLLIHVRSSVVQRSKKLVLCTLITSVFSVLLSDK